MDVGSLKSPAPLIAANSRAAVSVTQQPLSLSRTDLSRQERPVEQADSAKSLRVSGKLFLPMKWLEPFQPSVNLYSR